MFVHVDAVRNFEKYSAPSFPCALCKNWIDGRGSNPIAGTSSDPVAKINILARVTLASPSVCRRYKAIQILRRIDKLSLYL